MLPPRTRWRSARRTAILGGRDVITEGQDLMQHQDGIAKAIGLDQWAAPFVPVWKCARRVTSPWRAM